MSAHSVRRVNRVLPAIDVPEAILGMSPLERIELAVDMARRRIDAGGLQDFFASPMVPARGASEDELRALEGQLACPLPEEYRLFLSRHRYLVLDDGFNVGGLDHDGVQPAEMVWVSEKHERGSRFLVFGAYWRHADGDQLMFDLDAPGQPVVAYLHEHGPSIEPFAPTFSLALWRLVASVVGDDSVVGGEA